MKICFIHNSYGTEVSSGAQRIVKNLAEYLAAHNHEITVLTCSSSRSIELRSDALVRVVSLPSNYSHLVSWPMWRRLATHLFGFFNLRAYFRMRRFMQQEDFDIVWTHNLVGFGFIVFKALTAKIKIHTCHDIQLLHPSGLLIYGKEKILTTPWAKLYQALVRLFFPQEALVIFPSHWLKQLSQDHKLVLTNKKLVLANPLRVFKNDSAAQTINNFTFLYLGQLEQHKGITVLVKAFNKLADPNCRLVIAGNGSLFNELKAIADNRVSFLGNITNPEEFIRRSSCVVVPSLCYENLPTAALEAMNEKIPVIGSKLGGLKELLQDDQLLFEPTEQGIARVLDWCLNNPENLKNVATLARQQFKIPTLDSYLLEIGSLVKITF